MVPVVCPSAVVSGIVGIKPTVGFEIWNSHITYQDTAGPMAEQLKAAILLILAGIDSKDPSH
jgi:Asp-tRNA(Asn)/Glu-tRNA(Gln) amidotransferase A subunit family amidase